MADLELKPPSLEALPQYADALRRGWSPDNIHGRKTAEEQLVRIAEDPAAFVASQDDPEARGPPIRLPDGSEVPRLPGYYRWIWDGEFCGTVGFRWAPGTAELPEHVFGHLGYGVVPWKQGLGYATRALGLILPAARAMGLPYVELTTDDENIASKRVIEANGGMLVETFAVPPAYGGEGVKLRYRIGL
ncbi:MAG: GNAT family N-acetyltransferase [Phenylobacterium sp.]|uniref:GNAT family N-acetyltransferase n=1 Tax=Phenylobacterium sp. TaxID=1871053 RepID=UPI001225B485|nr:GNAT family N-acetyltransferase [Phenylobacterium sp.]TAJ71881.1 MAG: GNAT family N-acetyltransferase [Phenylobacterium sp.]